MRLRPIHLLAAMLPAASAQAGCCCAVPSAGNTLQHKVVSGCATAKCGGALLAACDKACKGSEKHGEACAFCSLSQHRTCGTSSACADFCAGPKGCDYLACSGCSKCKQEAMKNAAQEQQQKEDSKKAVTGSEASCVYWWCEAHPSPWTRKCSFDSCSGCTACGGDGGAASSGGTASDGPTVTSDLEAAFATFGFPMPLPLLKVEFANGYEQVMGEKTHFIKDDDALRKPPAISWDAAKVPKGIVVMMDLDAGGRNGADGAAPGPLGPAIQGLWVGCTGGSIGHCQYNIVPYSAPHAAKGTHRCTFMLLNQQHTFVRDIFEHYTPKHNEDPPPTAVIKWNFPRFLKGNWPDWKQGSEANSPLIAYNFFYFSGSISERDLDPKRQPPWIDPPAMPPPWSPSPPPPPPEPPLPPPQSPKFWWGDQREDTKKPWEH